MNDQNIIDWLHFERQRTQLGSSFLRLLGYFREDGLSALDQLEAAMRAEDVTALVIPADRLRDEAQRFGAESLSDLAELIHTTALHCVGRRFPDELTERVVQLRQLFGKTFRQFDEAAANPVVSRVPDATSRRHMHTSGRPSLTGRFGRAVGEKAGPI